MYTHLERHRAPSRCMPTMTQNYSGGESAALLRMVDELADLANEARRTSTMSGPKSTIGIVLNGIAIDFMIPGGPAHDEDLLESKDEILEVDGVAVDSNSINLALKGSDEIGSMVRLGVRKADDGKRVDVVLKRTSLTYIHHMQVYLELVDQLKSACKRNPDLSDIVRRLTSKIKELDSFHASVEHELRKSIRKYNTALPQISEMLRRSQQGGNGSGGALVSAETQRVIDRLQHQLQAAEENQDRLKRQLESSSRSGGTRDDEPGMTMEVQRLRVLLNECQKDKDSLQFRNDQISKDLNKLKLVGPTLHESQGATNSRLADIR